MSDCRAGRKFRREVEALSQQSSQRNVYPRPDLYILDKYLKSSPNSRFAPNDPNISSTATDEGVTSNFVVMHDIKEGTNAAFGSKPHDIDNFALVPKKKPHLLFMRGYGSTQWLATIGEIYKINPELYRRHLSFEPFSSGTQEFYSSPALPSSSVRIFDLTISTVYCRNVADTAYEPEDLQEARKLQARALDQYFKQFCDRVQLADSVVRKCLLLSKREYVLEQTITIEVRHREETCHAIVWLDSGKDLSHSVQGPWSPLSGTRPWETRFVPVIVHQAVDARSHSTLDRSEPVMGSRSVPTSSENNPPPSRQETEWRAAQNICLLPFQYGSMIDREVAEQDALYAVSEVFQFAASSELQFLNLLHGRIKHELSFTGEQQKMGRRNDAVSLLNLRFIKTQLISHAQRLAETVRTLETCDLLGWQRDQESPKAQQRARLLLSDFGYLLQRAEGLARECDSGIDTLVNSSILEESRRSTENAIRVQKLTVLATIFIPLSFVCTVWGMNFQELGSGTQPVWMWFVTAGPVILVSLLMYHFDTLIHLLRTTFGPD
ncbi:hypothetical protein BDBG_08754 [Blastomyces gilchristii SLH14081]|uniref:CorA family metal ion transporter n=1 Tax=Blastomyces gilchristii (strain SLH14081) TaxID=559298 RepID=A0A179V2N2_BLAGS|nr:uncharacterized protein BDBG_08754 [Blastomyces gilchristii SLH14081]OAT13581.1 hypothetical protein BDBG_08754 [Blastomyces gilchristii SLH14081]